LPDLLPGRIAGQFRDTPVTALTGRRQPGPSGFLSQFRNIADSRNHPPRQSAKQRCYQ